MSRRLTAPASYTLLAPLTNSTQDPVAGVVVTKFRTGFIQQPIAFPDAVTRTALVSSTSGKALGTITVVDATFDGADEVFIGDYVFEHGVHYTGVVGDTDATATALATAISNAGFTAAAVGNVITVEGPAGIQGTLTQFKVITRSSLVQFELSGNGFLQTATPAILPREIIP